MNFILLGVITVVLFVLNLFTGSVDIPAARVVEILMGESDPSNPLAFIVLGSRLPQAVTALLAGAGLAVAGLMLQTAFRNPLAGPSILGINSGASLGVALVVLLFGSSISAGGYTFGGYAAIMAGSLLGSVSIMALLLLFSTWLKDNLMLLIAGIMVGYLASSLITLLNFTASAEGVHGYVMWGMGNFNGVSRSQLPVFSGMVIAGLGIAVLLVKSLNIIQLGESYAKNLGVSMQRVRNLLLLATGVLVAVITAFCGPVSFIGLAVPHIARMIFRRADHRILLPGCMLSGAAVALLCNLVCTIPATSILPLNGVTPIIGVPVILYVILRERRR